MPDKSDALSFSSLGLNRELLQVVAELGYTHATPVQAASIPALLSGRDLVGQSKTGSGKTVAFTLPILQSLNLQTKKVQALILCPTRELCTQVTREIRKLGRRHAGLNVVTLVGGQPGKPQAMSLRQGPHIAVGTPGRVLDHLQRGALDLSSLAILVLDEADRMLDMGFQEEMEAILSEAPPARQTAFFSATFPESIEGMSAAYQKDPAHVKIAEDDSAKPAITERLYEVAEEDKLNALLGVLASSEAESAIVFCNLKATVADLADALAEAGVSAAGLHGDLVQEARDKVMAKFRNASLRVLVATDVAARGIDVAGLDLVVNFDFPKPDTYVHRIGRTGRAGKEGLAASFLLPSEKYKLKGLAEALGRELTPEPLPMAEGPLEVKAERAQAAMVTFYIGGGRKEKVRPGDILGALTGDAAGLAGTDVGKIEIHDHFAYVAVAAAVAPAALSRLRDGKIKGRKFRVELVD
ncbi:MAG: ATP-dependent RNA helicase DbpA [Proteobacteria bacterium]|nr:MAG: ATP-dependent RNA helicase DbpA [Pseudomonadota bacterium]